MQLVYKDFSSQLLKWHKRNGRFNLPWVGINDPYKIWLSEIMLQQTQVKTVLRYYSKFIQRFPTIESLAIANQETVLKHWVGLGFYKRAINLHDSAKVIIKKNNGIFPNNFDDLITYLVISIIIGGRLGYVAFYNIQYYLSNPIDILKIWEGGMSFHGALVGIILGTYIFSIRRKIETLFSLLFCLI